MRRRIPSPEIWASDGRYGTDRLADQFELNVFWTAEHIVKWMEVRGMAHSRVTLSDVAAAAEVSTATASRVLNGIEGASSAATAERITNAARELGYVPNTLAASLRSDKTLTAGLILADVGNPYFGLLASGVENVLAAKGYSLLLANTGNSPDRERALLRLMLERQVDAIVLASSCATGDHITEAIGRNVKVVLVDSDLDDVKADCVAVDNLGASDEAVSHLVSIGHVDVGIITGPLVASFDIERLEGYRKALARARIAAASDLASAGDSTVAGGHEAMSQLLQRGNRPTAVFVTNNLMTVGALAAISEIGLRVPDDISVVGFDDMDWYELPTVGITAVSQPAYELGTVAAKRLLLRIQRKRQPAPERFVLPTELKLRSSTTRLLAPDDLR